MRASAPASAVIRPGSYPIARFDLVLLRVPKHALHKLVPVPAGRVLQRASSQHSLEGSPQRCGRSRKRLRHLEKLA